MKAPSAGQGRSRHPWREALSVAAALEGVAFAAFTVFVVISNDFDWDHFLAASEVDLRAWLVDSDAPTWSYQLCGGVTREGDPQALGQSPLFAFVLALGSFWGLKLAWPALALVGHGAMRRLLALFFTQGQPGRKLGPGDEAVLRALSLSFVLGNGLLWRAHHGHVTFALDLLALFIVERVLRASLSPLPRVQLLVLLAVVAAAFTSGIYQAVVFLLLPLALAFALALAVTAAGRRWRGWPTVGSLPGLGLAALAVTLGVAFAGPRLFAVLAYQASVPRSLTPLASAPGVDGATLAQTLVFQLLPTVNYQFAGVLKGFGPWGIWETSTFTIGAWVAVGALLAVGLAHLRRRTHPAPRDTPATRPLGVLLAALLLVTWGFAVGDAAPVSLYRLLNILTHDSVRVAGRFQLLYALAAACGAALLLGRHRWLRRPLTPWLAVLTPLSVCLNLFSFVPTLRPESFAELPRRVPPSPVRELTLVRPRDARGLPMYTEILANRAVLNCYDPIARDTHITREKVGRAELMGPDGTLRAGLRVPLIDPTVGAPSEACRERSWLSQVRVHLDPSCGPGTCVNLNGLNPDEPSALSLHPQLGKYCLPP